MIQHLLDRMIHAGDYAKTFFRWIFLALITGILGGVIGSPFHIAVEKATELRGEHPWLLYLLPAAGVIIALLYRLLRTPENFGTNQIIEAAQGDRTIPLALAPLIFVSTVLTHLCGGSAGREGAALQLGGTIGSQVGKWFRLNDKDMRLIVMCGMSAVFSALFGTPLTAAFFSMEVISIGIIYYTGLVPCIVSSLTAYFISLMFGAHPVHFDLAFVPALAPLTLVRIILLSALCATVSIFLCSVMHSSHHKLAHWMPNAYLRAIVGGVAIIGLTLLLGTTAYNGAGMDVVEAAIAGTARPEAFLLKILFTAITIGCGFKGGEIVPTFFIGATFGCVAGELLGLDPGFAAAIGLIALFCSVVNSPVASILLSVELFGAEGILFFAAACAVSYMLSGNYGLYSSQKIIYSKLRIEHIDRKAH